MKKGTSGKTIGDQNATMLKAWLDTVEELPMHGGKPNKTEIARLAGLKDRQPLENNKSCITLLEAALKSKGLSATSRTDDERSKLEKRIRTLETRADKENAENFELKRKLRKLQHIESIIEAGGRIIP
jgi:predicted RNase H-like nuclease (RuvC/YqgF family)